MRYIFLFLFVFKLHAEFHVCTVASHITDNLNKLQRSCEMHGIDLEVLGLGLPYGGNGTKLVYMTEYVNTLPDDDIVMFVDAYDVLIVADKEVILDKFLKMNTPFLMSAEKNCYPPQLNGRYPPMNTPFRYINTGSFIGYAGIMKAWLADLAPINPNISDQLQVASRYLDGHVFFTLDHQCELFLPLYMVKDPEVTIENGTVYCNTTHSEPSVIHANGRSFRIWDRIYEELIDLVKNNPGQLSVEEYALIAQTLIDKAPCNMLVFGVGKDSPLWIKLNEEGTTAFLEDNPTWLNSVPEIEAYLVTYNTKRTQWKQLLNNEAALSMELPTEISARKWDIIFVDAPEGWRDDKPGRMKSIYTAAQLARNSPECHVFVHDCDRPVEAAYTDKYLRSENLLATKGRLRHYYFNP